MECYQWIIKQKSINLDVKKQIQADLKIIIDINQTLGYISIMISNQAGQDTRGKKMKYCLKMVANKEWGIVCYEKDGQHCYEIQARGFRYRKEAQDFANKNLIKINPYVQ